MRDAVAEVLARRTTLDRGAGAGFALSLLLHGGLAGLAVYSALHAAAPRPVSTLNIQFAQLPPAPAMTKPAVQKPAAPAPVTPRIDEPQPKIEEPKPQLVEPPKKPPEKNTVPLSPFGRSPKKGAESPAVAPPTRSPATGTAPPGPAVGAAGVTGLEGGDFPYTLYLDGMQRRIGGNWFRPQVAGATVVIYFRILRDGTISDAKVETPSGNSVFDRAALSAVRSSSPLNPLPFAYNGNFLGVHLTFR